MIIVAYAEHNLTTNLYVEFMHLLYIVISWQIDVV